MTVATELQELLAPPSVQQSREYARASLASLLPKPIVLSRVEASLTPLLKAEQAERDTLNSRYGVSNAQIVALVKSSKSQLTDLQHRSRALKASHEALEDELIDHRENLHTSLAQREKGQDGTLRERLETLSLRRKELESAKEWFRLLAEAENLGISSLASLEAFQLPQAFQSYIDLIALIGKVHTNLPDLALTSHLVSMASSVWHSLVRVLSNRLSEQLANINWPTPLKEPIHYIDDDAFASKFKDAFINLLELEKISMQHPLSFETEQSSDKAGVEAKPLLALVPLVRPLLLKMRWHFDGDRSTNRIDKLEYPLAHVLNLLSTHDRFIGEDIQDLLDQNGFPDVDAKIDFTSLLLPYLSSRLEHHVPQMLSMPPILAHTIYQSLEFDGVLKDRKYHPRGLQGDWAGLSEVILGEKEWFDQWLKGEREFFESRYYTAISAQDAWQILSEEDYDATDARSGTRPSNSALRVAELVEQLGDRYKPLPTIHTLPFLLSLHLPLLQNYAQRITSSLDAFESLSFGLLPGALADNRGATAGVGGVTRLVRAGVSARWMSEKCAEWGEDAFFLGLYAFITTNSLGPEMRVLAHPIVATSNGTLFDGIRKEFQSLADRAEELIQRHVVREVINEMKAYLGRRWDFDASEGEEDLTLTPELLPALSLFSALLSVVTSSFPTSVATTLYRRISISLSVSLYERLLINRAWSEAGARHLNYDLEHGFLQAGREAGIKRGVARGWDLLLGGAKIMSLPASTSASGSHLSFSKVMQFAFDDTVAEGEGTQFNLAMEELGVGEVMGKKEVQAVMRRRPECWR